MTADKLTPARLRQLLTYDQETGRLFWKRREGVRKEWNTRYAGKEALATLTPKGYLAGEIFNKGYLAHRVIWTMMTGAWPAEEIDHISGDRADNRMTNLREATRAQNSQNIKSARGSSSRFLGVSWDKASEKWRAHIRIDGKTKNLGRFDDEMEAARAYDNAARAAFGEYANPNFEDCK